MKEGGGARAGLSGSSGWCRQSPRTGMVYGEGVQEQTLFPERLLSLFGLVRNWIQSWKGPKEHLRVTMDSL